MNIPLNIDFQQILLHLFNLVLLFAILYFLLYNPVKKFMDDRARRYEELDAQRKAALAAAQEQQQHYTELLAKADDAIAARSHEALCKAQQEHDAILNTAKKEADAILTRANARAEEVLCHAEQQAKDALVDLVAKTAEEKLAQACTIESFAAEASHEKG